MERAPRPPDLCHRIQTQLLWQWPLSSGGQQVHELLLVPQPLSASGTSTPEDLFDSTCGDLGCKKCLLSYPLYAHHLRKKAVSLICLCTPTCPIMPVVNFDSFTSTGGMVGTPSLGMGGYREWSSISVSTSHYFLFDFITQVSGVFLL